MRPPGGVYFAAFVSRFDSTCTMRAMSASTVRPLAGTDTSKRVPALDDQRVGHVDGAIDRVADLEAAPFELDLAARQARHVEQIVDQPHHVRDLPLEDLPFSREGLRVAGLHQFQRGQRRRQRIPQLVAEDGQELILRPAGLFGLGARGIGALDFGVALAGALLEQRGRRRERPLQPARLRDVPAGLP